MFGIQPKKSSSTAPQSNCSSSEGRLFWRRDCERIETGRDTPDALEIPSEIERLYSFCGFSVDRSKIDELISGFDHDLVERASRSGPHDEEIHRLMKAQDAT